MTVSDATPAPWSWELASGENAAYPKQDQPCYLFAGTNGLAVRADYGSCGPIPARARLVCAAGRARPSRRRHSIRWPSSSGISFAVIARRETPLISVEDAMGTLAVVEAVSEAARTGPEISPGQIMEQAA